jgi:NADH-quinone oxidoreductase subunit H
MSIEMIFYLLIFPGLLFTSILGLTVGWIDRKVSARFQFRVGPPFFQNFNDFFKLIGKETIIVKDGIHPMFILAPFIAFAMIVVVSAIIGTALFFGESFGGDIIVVMYLLMLFSVAVIIGGSSSGNVYSSLGAGREIKLLLADELAFILVLLVPIIKSGYQLNLQEFLSFQNHNGILITSASGIIAFIIGLICIQAKMTLPPFHIPEAETEIVEGPFMEYSGPPLAFWKLNHFMLYVIFPFLLILLFWGGFNFEGIQILWSILKYLLIIVLMIIIKNTNPRIRIDTALKFFWIYAAPLGIFAVVLAVFGY